MMPLDLILSEPADKARLAAANKLVFHVIGDSGGVHGTVIQEAIAAAMEKQFDVAAEADRPYFMYHVGDVVYFNGLSSQYLEQFYEPYQFYPAPIFAIPGNHDGDTLTQKGDEPDNEPTLTGFTTNFCAPQAEFLFKHRELMTQPYVYWTLDAPFVRIIGLYSNVDGSLDGRGTNEQQSWFEQQVAAAPADKWLVVAVHHPPYSLDSVHGGCPAIVASIERAASVANRWPDAVLSGHVHNYQRFTKKTNGKDIPFIVTGACGYANTLKAMHKMQAGIPAGRPFQTTLSDVVLEHFNSTASGFLRIAADDKQMSFDYYAVPFDGDPPAEPEDSCTLSKRTHRLS
jgi:Icc-related predicted phosphoesterase